MEKKEIILSEISNERSKQDIMWGEQNHPDGTGPVASHHWGILADAAREDCERAARAKRLTWVDILREEVYEAFAEPDSEKLRTELIQAAAVIVAWIESIDRRNKEPNG